MSQGPAIHGRGSVMRLIGFLKVTNEIFMRDFITNVITLDMDTDNSDCEIKSIDLSNNESEKAHV